MLLLVDRAKLLAKFVHADEKRRGGEPYFNHCERVANMVKKKGRIIECEALIHDVRENAKNPDTIKQLIIDYFPIEVSNVVEILTHDKNIPYDKYIEKVCMNPNAFEIKIADIIDNTEDKIPEKQFNKYKESCIYIMSKGKNIPQILKERLKIQGDLNV